MCNFASVCLILPNLFDLSLITALIKHFPPFEPGMFGVAVHNYHYWSNLVVAELIMVFGLPLMATDYQYLTIVISLWLGLTAIVFTKLVKLDKKYAVSLPSPAFWAGRKRSGLSWWGSLSDRLSVALCHDTSKADAVKRILGILWKAARRADVDRPIPPRSTSNDANAPSTSTGEIASGGAIVRGAIAAFVKVVLA